ncbi:MAG: heavy metal translocating P-type ATPase metal-binding domain-containing protein [Opitutales bacterium]
MTTVTMPTQRACKHCGTRFRPRDESEAFCCAGCEYVHRLLHDRGLTRFYDLKDRTLQPVSSAVFHPGENLDWLDARARQTEGEAVEGRPASLELGLTGISCVGCVWLVEKVFIDQPGALRINVNAQLGRARLQWQPGAFEVRDFARELQRFGYRLGQPGNESEASAQQRGLGLRIGVCAFLALNTMLFTLPRYLGMEDNFQFARLFELLNALFASLSLAVGGSYFIERAVRGLRRGVLHIDLPIALGLVAAWTGSMVGWLLQAERLLYFDFVSIFVFLMLVGRWLQEAAIERNRSRLTGERPDTLNVQRLDAASTEPSGPASVTAAALRKGDHFAVRPGQVVPVRARLLQSEATLSLEWINGESEPCAWKPGQMVPAGAVNISSEPLALEALEVWEASLLAKLLQGDEAEHRNPRLEGILRVYLMIVLALSVAGSVAWLSTQSDWTRALEVLIAVLVVSCPCALGVAWPLTEELSASALRRRGVYLREPTVWERLEAVRHIFFDKTGTLTLESPRLLNPEALSALTPGNQQVLYRLVEESLHPVGRSLRENLLRLPGFTPQAYPDSQDTQFEEVPGQGVGLRDEANHWRLGRPGWASTTAASTEGTDAVFSHNEAVLARLRFEDAVRRDAREQLERLRSAGYALAILSGDRQKKVDTMAQALGLEPAAACGGLSPEQKQAAVVAAGGSSVLMVGDGANDSLAFDAAGVRATPVVDKGLLEQKADFYFLGQDLTGIESVFAVGRRRRRALRAVFAFTTTYNLTVVSIALAGWMSPLLAAILMPLSSLTSLAIAVGGMGRRRR